MADLDWLIDDVPDAVGVSLFRVLEADWDHDKLGSAVTVSEPEGVGGGVSVVDSVMLPTDFDVSDTE